MKWSSWLIGWMQIWTIQFWWTFAKISVSRKCSVSPGQNLRKHRARAWRTYRKLRIPLMPEKFRSLKRMWTSKWKIWLRNRKINLILLMLLLVAKELSIAINCIKSNSLIARSLSLTSTKLVLGLVCPVSGADAAWCKTAERSWSTAFI